MKLKPEEKVEIKIGVWLMQNGCDVYFNRKSKKFDILIPNYKIFKTIGSAKKPDIIFKSNKTNQYLAIELKDASKTINLRKGVKIKEYYCDYVKGITKYIINEKEIEIKQFLIGSQFSTEGHLFNNEGGFINSLASPKEGKRFAAKIGVIPNFEYNRTHDLIRQLWQDWNLKIKDKKAGMGILVSDSLNELTENEFCEGKPAILSQEFNPIKKRWKQYWSGL